MSVPAKPRPCAVPDPRFVYRPRDPERLLLHQTVRRGLETFLVRQQSRDRPVPGFVEREMRGFLECGVLAHGFVRVHCDDCGQDRVVGFSCKGRGFCSSCGGRRMADTAAHLVDRVLPVVPVRQWVLTVPFPLRFRMAYDAALVGDVLRIFVRAVFSSIRRRARRRWSMARPQGGAVTFVQRFGDALNLNIHFHTLVLDGAYESHPERSFGFLPLPAPSPEEFDRILQRIARQLLRLRERRGMDGDGDAILEDAPLLTALYAASIRGQTATGPRTGRGVQRLGDRIDPEDLEEDPENLCVRAHGFSLHAGVSVPAGDRARLERLCRYVARPPVATERLSRLTDGRLLYRLKRRWRDGTTHVIFEPQELLERLAALVPPPRAHQVRYHGILAPCAGRRPQAVPQPPAPVPSEPNRSTPVRSSGSAASPRSANTDPAGGWKRRYAWAALMQRVFSVDVLRCPRCSGRMRILAAIHDPASARAILECLGLPSRAPPNAPAEPEPDALA